jgi:hypothetical protein
VGPEYIAPGSEIVGFDTILPESDETCLRHIDRSLKSGLPEAVVRKKLIVIANGPTAKTCDLRSLSSPTLAVNASLSLFIDQEMAPTYWAACDPSEPIAEFLPENPPMDTVYFVASKCHPKVFEKLKGRDVRLWHLMDHPAVNRSRIALASSVTLSGSWLMHRLGYTDFEYYGWDGCFLDGEHHAVGDQNWSHIPILHLNYGGIIKNGEVIGGRTFSTTRTWAAEAKGAEQFFQLAEYFDIGIKIHGDAMFECVRQSIMDKAA